MAVGVVSQKPDDATCYEKMMRGSECAMKCTKNKDHVSGCHSTVYGRNQFTPPSALSDKLHN